MNTIRVIIADDERLPREYLKQLIVAYSNVELLCECKTGLETVNAVFSHQPDLVFLDIQMPDLNGFEVIEEIKKEKGEESLLIVLSDHGMTDDGNHGGASGPPTRPCRRARPNGAGNAPPPGPHGPALAHTTMPAPDPCRSTKTKACRRASAP